MPNLALSEEQASVLGEVLDRILGDLSVEIADTDLKSFRDDLKDRREHLQAIKAQLG